MKKLFIIAAFGLVVSLAAGSASAVWEVRVRPNQAQLDQQRYQQQQEQQRYQQQRDQQWVQAQENQRVQNRRTEQLRVEQQQRVQWQRNQWQVEQRRRHLRHQQEQSYEVWLEFHMNDYGNRR